MVPERSALASVGSSAIPVFTGLVAAAIFVADTFTPLTDAVASLYVIVVLLSVSFLRSRGVLLVSVGCVAIAIMSYLWQHAAEPPSDALVRLLVSLAAIIAVSFLAQKNRTATATAEDRARLLDLTHDTIFARDMKDRITYWNSGAENLYEWSGAEALGRTSHELMQTVFQQPLEAINAELLRTGRWEGEVVHTTRRGRRLVVASRWSLQRDDSGNPVAILETNNDITERKHAEEALTRSEAYLTEAQNLSHTGSFGLNFSTGDIVWSEETYRIFQLDPAVHPTLDIVYRNTHPDDVRYVRNAVERAARNMTGFEVKHRLLLPDGTVKHVHAVARAVTGASSIEFVGAVTDVTATK
ncbi:MAG: sensor histidine kinase, partial [Devosia sp.]|uniref:PAS domain-containing protein n=1 Tax=Devosia sp. TaxID=1871048 RepID=UPI00261B2F99